MRSNCFFIGSVFQWFPKITDSCIRHIFLSTKKTIRFTHTQRTKNVVHSKRACIVVVNANFCVNSTGKIATPSESSCPAHDATGNSYEDHDICFSRRRDFASCCNECWDCRLHHMQYLPSSPLHRFEFGTRCLLSISRRNIVRGINTHINFYNHRPSKNINFRFIFFVKFMSISMRLRSRGMHICHSQSFRSFLFCSRGRIFDVNAWPFWKAFCLCGGDGPLCNSISVQPVLFGLHHR